MNPQEALFHSLVDEIQSNAFHIPFDVYYYLCKKLRSELHDRFPNNNFEELTEVESRLAYARYMCHVTENYRELYKSIITGFSGFALPAEVKQMILMSESMLSDPLPDKTPGRNHLVDYEDDDDTDAENTNNRDENNSSPVDPEVNKNNNFCQPFNSCDNNNNDDDDGQQDEHDEEYTRNSPWLTKESIDSRPLSLFINPENPEPPRKVIKRENKEIIIQFSQIVPSPPPLCETISVSSLGDSLSSSSLPDYETESQMNGTMVNGQQKQVVTKIELASHFQQQSDIHNSNPINHNEETNSNGVQQESAMGHLNAETGEPPNIQVGTSTSNSSNISDKVPLAVNLKMEYRSNPPPPPSRLIPWKTPRKINLSKLTRMKNRSQRIIPSGSEGFVLLECVRHEDPRLTEAENQALINDGSQSSDLTILYQQQK